MVEDDADVGYVAVNSISASRVAVDFDKNPISIVAIGEEMLGDLAATNPKEAIQYISGIQGASDQFPFQQQFSIRGNPAGGINFRDGLPENIAAADNPMGE